MIKTTNRLNGKANGHNHKPVIEQVPKATEIEYAALGCILQAAGDDELQRNASRLLSQLSDSLFWDDRHKIMFNGLTALNNDGLSLDVRTLQRWLMDKGKTQQAGGAAYVSGCPDQGCLIGVFPTHLATLQDKAARRQVLQVAAKAKRLVEDVSLDPAALLNEFTELATRTATKSTQRRQWLSFKSPKECREWQPPKDWVLIGDHHIVRGSVTILAGPPGCGKSRALNWLATCGAKGESQQWFGLKVHSKFKTAIIQAENGPYRLKMDFEEVKAKDIESSVRVTEPPAFGFQFGNPEFRDYVAEQLTEFGPDVVALDPWNRIVGDDSARDFTEGLDNLRETFRKLPRPPAIVIVHHFKKGDGSERWSIRSLLDRLSGSYTLGSGARCVLGMIHASDDATEDRIVFCCTKNNDGPLGDRTAWHRRGSHFKQVEDFDWEEFETPPLPGGPKITKDIMEQVFEGGKRRATRKLIMEALMDPPFGFKKSAAYLATQLNGRFAGHLSTATDGTLVWSSVPNLQPALPLNA